MCAREVPREHRDGHAGVWKNHLPEDQSPRREQRMLPEGPEHEGIGHGAVCLQWLSEPLRPPGTSWVMGASSQSFTTTRTKCKWPQGLHCRDSKTGHAGRESVYQPIKALDRGQAPAATAPTAFLSELT